VGLSIVGKTRPNRLAAEQKEQEVEMIRLISREVAKAQGLKRYFNGHPCIRGHVAERFVADGRCVECKRERRRYERGDRDKHVMRSLALHIIRDSETEQILRESRCQDETPNLPQQSPLIDRDER
jgi:hypothetical protein